MHTVYTVKILQTTIFSYSLWVSPQLEAADQAGPPFSPPLTPRLVFVSRPQTLGGSAAWCHWPQESAVHLPLQIQGHGRTAGIHKIKMKPRRNSWACESVFKKREGRVQHWLHEHTLAEHHTYKEWGQIHILRCNREIRLILYTKRQPFSILDTQTEQMSLLGDISRCFNYKCFHFKGPINGTKENTCRRQPPPKDNNLTVFW